MKIGKFIQAAFKVFIMTSLLVATTTSVSAQGEDYIGQVSNSISRSLPTPKSILNLISPLASQPLPGGGTATATALLSWSASKMDGKAISSLSANTPGTYSICATATQLFMNGSGQGGAGQVCASKTGGGSVTSTKSKIVASVFGKSWRVDTAHAFTKSGWNGWFPTLSASVNL